VTRLPTPDERQKAILDALGTPLQQPPQSTRRNALPVKRIDGALLMGHKYLACALV
jgi:hypothetical protein